MKRRSAYTLSMLTLAAIVAVLAWTQRSGHSTGTASDGRRRAALVVFDQPRPMPSLHFKNAAGQTLTLADFRGRVLLVNIWATWCTPCREEMPSLDRLQARLGGPKFQVVAISQDRAGLDAVNAFFEAVGIQHLKRYIDIDAQGLEALGKIGIPVRGIPTSVLVDRQGRARGYAIGARQWDTPAMIKRIKRATHLGGGPTPTHITMR